MSKTRGTKPMKKTIATLIMISMLAMTASAVSLMSDASIYSITETALLPSVFSPLAGLDLIPEPAPKAGYATMILDPDQVVINPGHRYLTQGFRAGRAVDAMFDASLLATVALNIADYLSTTEALKYPGLSEGNPIMKPFVKNPYVFAAVKAGFTAFSYLSMKSLYKRNKPLAWILSTAANMAMGYVVSNNYQMIKMAKGR